MKTAEQAIREIHTANYLYAEGEITHDELEEKLENILLDWGRELCREQRVIASSIIDEQAGTLNEAVKLCFNAPLPEILNNK